MFASQSECKNSDRLSKRNFQVQKIFVERLPDEKDLVALEQALANYYTSFGSVIDVKVLRNGLIIRLRPAVCLRDLRR